MMPNMIIYQGEFRQGKNLPVGLLLYPTGDIYCGQHNQMIKNGIGKIIHFNGGFEEGNWDQDTWKVWTTAVKEATGCKGKQLFMPLRQALTGMDHGPELKVLLPLIGREKAVARLKGEAA